MYSLGNYKPLYTNQTLFYHNNYCWMKFITSDIIQLGESVYISVLDLCGKICSITIDGNRIDGFIKGTAGICFQFSIMDSSKIQPPKSNSTASRLAHVGLRYKTYGLDGEIHAALCMVPVPVSIHDFWRESFPNTSPLQASAASC
jgi:hypothetical protein